jgi:hypothetical protein
VGGRGLSIAEHVSFIDHALSVFFDWRALVVGLVSSLGSLIGISAIRDWTPLSIILTSIAVGAGVSITYIAVQLFMRYRRATRALPKARYERQVPQTQLRADLTAVEGFKSILAGRGRSECAISCLDQLSARLSREIHDRLRQGNLVAWGRPSHDLPQRRILAREWDSIEISFDRRTLTSTMLDDSTAPIHACAWTRKNIRDRKLAYVEICFCGVQFYDLFPPMR